MTPSRSLEPPQPGAAWTSTPFAITVTAAQGWSRLALQGELDLATVAALEHELERAEQRRPALVLLDLRKLTFMDVRGMRALLAADARARGRGGELAVLNAPRVVRRLLGLVGAEGKLDLRDDSAVFRPERLLTACEAR